MDKGDLKYILVLVVLILIFYLPAIIHPNMMMGRGDDLVSQTYYYWDYAKQSITETGEFPMWDTGLFSGSPFISKPNLPFWLPLVNIGALVILVIVVVTELKPKKISSEVKE